MDKLKNPKVYGPLIAAIVAVLIGLFADLRPVVAEICANVAPVEQPVQVDDLKP